MAKRQHKNADASKDELLTLIEGHESTIAMQNELIAELSDANSKLSAGVSETPSSVVVNGIHYRVAIPNFIHEGKHCTEADVRSLPALAAELVARGSGVLKPIK